MIKTIKTTPYTDQKMGTAGIRKKSKVARQENYVENFLQSAFDALGGVQGKTFVVGGDGRFYNDIAIQKFLKMACANGMKKIIMAQNGLISTPAFSNIIIKTKADGGFDFTSSHNPAGENGDFGIKIDGPNGGQTNDQTNAKVFENTKKITEYKICDHENIIDLSKIGTQKFCDMEIEIIDSVEDYITMMEEIFDFPAIKKLFQSGFTMTFDAMNAVTGPYAVKIFEDILGAAKGSVINKTPKPDFGGLHPDPNLVHAKELVDIMYSTNAPDFGAANDGDGDRNMIMGKNIFISPSDSLAIITDNYKCIPAYKNGIKGVAKSAATSTAVNRTAKALNLPCYEVPTGWKYFGNLMDSGRITFCGEESFGTASDHIREKDGIWAVLYWLNIIATTGKSVHEIALEHWQKYGRGYYMRFDFEEIPTEIADKLITDLESKLPTLPNAKPFVYDDPVDGSSTQNGYIIWTEDGSRIFYRLSGTGTVGATLRVYIEKVVTDKNKLEEKPEQMLESTFQYAMEVLEITQRTGKQKPDVIT